MLAWFRLWSGYLRHPAGRVPAPGRRSHEPDQGGLEPRQLLGPDRLGPPAAQLLEDGLALPHDLVPQGGDR